MADPLDLEALKKWAEARKDLAGDLFVNHFGYGGVDRDNFIEVCERVYQRGLDRAIEIAEYAWNTYEAGLDHRGQLEDELVQARQDAGEAMLLVESVEHRLGVAIQDVLMLRDAIRSSYMPRYTYEALEATAHYEQHRQTQEGGGEGVRARAEGGGTP